MSIQCLPGFLSSAGNGDIRLIASPGTPYDSWSAPVMVTNDLSNMAQGYAALKVKGGQVNLIWEDHRQVPGAGVGWSEDRRVSDASSLTNFVFIGDYISLTNVLAGKNRVLFGICTEPLWLARALPNTHSPDSGSRIGRYFADEGESLLNRDFVEAHPAPNGGP